MSKPIAVISIVLVLILGVSLYQNSFGSDSGNLKKLSLRPYKDILVHTYKLKSPFIVSLHNPNERAGQANERFTLEAQIEVEKEFTKIYYKWILPNGVQLSSGTAAAGQFNKVSPRETIKISAEFLNFTTTNKKIHLRVWSDEAQSQFLETAQYNTLDQIQIDQEHREMYGRQNAYLADHPELLKNYK